MSIFKADYFYNRIWDISTDFLEREEIKCVLLDVDNTLTTHDNPDIHPLAQKWLDSINSVGIIPVVISNNIEARVAPFADKIGAKYVCHAQKPKPKGIIEAEKITGISKSCMLMIGDQIFTDVLCGKFSKIKTALVEPFELEDMPFFKVKRFLEKIILKRKRG